MLVTSFIRPTQNLDLTTYVITWCYTPKIWFKNVGLNYAIIDEVDSILVDEARTPLIISGGAKQNQNLYQAADRFAKTLIDDDYFY